MDEKPILGYSEVFLTPEKTMLFKFFFTLLFFLTISLQAKPPTLSEQDTKMKIEEILKAHACHHILNETLMKRAFNNPLQNYSRKHFSTIQRLNLPNLKRCML